MEKLTCTVKKNEKTLNFFNDSSRSPKDKRHKDSSNSEDAFFEAYNLALPQKLIFSYISYSSPMNSTIQKFVLIFLPLPFLTMKNH